MVSIWQIQLGPKRLRMEVDQEEDDQVVEVAAAEKVAGDGVSGKHFAFYFFSLRSIFTFLLLYTLSTSSPSLSNKFLSRPRCQRGLMTAHPQSRILPYILLSNRSKWVLFCQNTFVPGSIRFPLRSPEIRHLPQRFELMECMRHK